MTSQEKKRVLKSETLNLFQNFVFTFLSLQFKFRVHPCIVLCCLIAFLPHPFAYFLTSGYLLQTPDNSNFFRFPLKVRVIGSRLYNYSVQLCYDAETREIGLLRFHEASPTQHRVDILGIIWHLCLKSRFNVKRLSSVKHRVQNEYLKRIARVKRVTSQMPKKSHSTNEMLHRHSSAPRII